MTIQGKCQTREDKSVFPLCQAPIAPRTVSEWQTDGSQFLHGKLEFIGFGGLCPHVTKRFTIHDVKSLDWTSGHLDCVGHAIQRGFARPTAFRS